MEIMVDCFGVGVNVWFYFSILTIPKVCYFISIQKGLIVHTLISNNKGEVLILQRSTKDDVLPGYWDLPGGTLEDGEDPSRGAIREVKEETSLDIKDVKLFFHTSNVDVSKNKQFVTLIFHAKISGDEVVVNPSEHETYKWINPTDISEYKTVHYLADCLKEYLKYLFLS